MRGVWTMAATEIDLELPVFDGRAAQRGYPLNAMCFSFNDAATRARFIENPEAKFREFGLDETPRRAVRERDVLGMIAAGGNAYYLLKLANLLGMDVQDVGAQQSGLSRQDFQARLQVQGARHGDHCRWHRHLPRPRDRRGHRQGGA